MKKYNAKYLSIIINIILFTLASPGRCFIPNIYLPSHKNLVDTSIGSGLSAAQYIKFGQTEEAIALAKLAISLNPKEVELWIILSRAQLNNNLLKESRTSIEEAIRINPQIGNVWFTKASIEMQMKNIKPAIKSINKYL